MSKYVFKSNVLHDKTSFKKGQECPKDLFDEMHKKGLVEALPEPAPVEPAKK